MRYPIIILYIVGALIAPAADFSFTGAFAQDDERRQFAFVLSQPGTVVVRTWSYAGGVNSTGARIAAGGFDPSLSIYDSTGLLIATNRDGGCSRVAVDPVTTLCWDAFVSARLPGGSYQVVLTESENTPQGPFLTDPFVYDGAGNFTAAPGANEPAGFWDFSPNRRNSSYAVDITGVDSAQSPLVPAVGSLVNGASWQGGAAGPNTIMTLFLRNPPGAQPVSVLIDGQSAEILFSGPTQVNFATPQAMVPNADALLQVSGGGNLLLATPLQIVDASPALFTANQSGTGQASVLNQDFSVNGAGSPAARGTMLMVYGTGFGVANPRGQDGLSWLASAVSATIGGVDAEVSFAGLAPGYTPGLQQINIRIPAGSPVGAAVPIRLQIVGRATQLGTTVAVN